jgi:Protein of unknown function (DUF2510)/Protein of unknown function (DUF3592)
MVILFQVMIQPTLPSNPNTTPMKRIQHLFNTLKTNWTTDPAARGAAKMTAGAILVAEGLTGAIAGGRNKKNSGIFGSLIGLVVGGVFIAVSLFIKPGTYQDEVRTKGSIAAVETSRNSKGKTMYQAVYAFQVEGKEHRFSPSFISNMRPNVGDPVDIAYSASNPENARRLDGLVGHFHWLFFGVGALVLVASFMGATVSLAMIGFGIWLFLSGRKDRKSVNDSSGFLTDLMSLAQRARSGEIDITRTAVGQPGRLQGDIDLFSPHPAVAATSASNTEAPASAPPSQSMPPAGWYADPADSSRQRWWDGTQWTDHFQ